MAAVKPLVLGQYGLLEQLQSDDTLSVQLPYRIAGAYVGAADNLSHNLTMHVVTNNITIPANLVGSKSYVENPATDTPLICTVDADRGSGRARVADLAFSIGGHTHSSVTWYLGGDLSLDVGDIVWIDRPGGANDTGFSNVCITLLGYHST